ncbi:MAG: acyl-CoA dehydrogenase family protein, partial [Saprospiraceae bacterium]|nr:acyl-CoA dehydrogenase family protein [Saprospiraceae bacterium]
MDTMTAEHKQIKGGSFLIEDATPDQIFVPEDISEEQQMIREMTRAFVKGEGERMHQLEAQVDLMEKAGELGLLGAHMPHKYGGMELDVNSNSYIAEEIGYGGGSFNTSFAAHTGIGMLPILYFGTGAQ